MNSCRTPAVRREVHVCQSSTGGETPDCAGASIEPVDVTGQCHVLPDLELIEVHRLVRDAELLAAVAGGEPPRVASGRRNAVDRREPVCVEPAVDDASVTIEAGPGDQVPVVRQSQHAGDWRPTAPAKPRLGKSHATGARASCRRPSCTPMAPKYGTPRPSTARAPRASLRRNAAPGPRGNTCRRHTSRSLRARRLGRRSPDRGARTILRRPPLGQSRGRRPPRHGLHLRDSLRTSRALRSARGAR